MRKYNNSVHVRTAHSRNCTFYLKFGNSDYGINKIDVFMLDCILHRTTHSNHCGGKQFWRTKKLGVKTQDLEKSNLPFFLDCVPESPIKISTWTFETACIN